jgi:hypothetical protein
MACKRSRVRVPVAPPIQTKQIKTRIYGVFFVFQRKPLLHYEAPSYIIRLNNVIARFSMTTKNSNQGFAHVGLVALILLVIAVVGFGGWYVWQKNKDDKQNGNTAQQDGQKQNDPERKPNGTNPATADPSEGGRYLVINEWNVRFPLGVSARENSVGYKYEGTDSNNANDSEIASVSLVVPEGSPLRDCMNIHIDRESDDFRESSTLTGFPIIASVDGYLFYERRNSPFCGTQDSQAEALMDELSSSIRSLESISKQ